MNNGLSFIPIGTALCYCYLTLRESNKTDNKPWYELDFLESLAIIYCMLIASIRANWILFISLLKIGIVGLLYTNNHCNWYLIKRGLVFLVALGWYVLYNIEEFKNMIILIMRKNSIEGENNYETDFEHALIENFVSETENRSEKKIPVYETITINEEKETFSEIDKNLDMLIPQIDKFIENFNADTKKYIEYVEQEGETAAEEQLNPVHRFSSEQLVSELERITDNLVRDTKKIADNVSLVSSMIVESSTIEPPTNFENENSASIVTPRNSKTTINAKNNEINVEKLIPETTAVPETKTAGYCCTSPIYE